MGKWARQGLGFGCVSRARAVVMRVFVAGASGVIGVRLLPLLVEAGHEVAGMTRSPEKVELLRRLGALPVVCDVFDRPALREAVIEFAPEAVVSELTDLPDDRERLHAFEAANDRMRREGHATCSMRRRLPRPHGFWPRASPGNFPASEAQPSTSSSRRCSRLAASCCATASCTGLEPSTSPSFPSPRVCTSRRPPLERP